MQLVGTSSFVATTLPNLSLRNGSSNFADYDNDGDMDFFINGTTGTTTNPTFQRLQNNNTVLASPTSIANTYSNNALFGDYNNDNKVDFFVGGRLYENNTASFSQTTFSFPNIPIGSSNFVDFDNDGDRDIFITGYESSSYQGVSRLFKNNKTNFAEVFPLGIANVQESASTFGDIDNDGDMDALICGWNGSARITKLYENRNGGFTENQSFSGVQNGSVALVDLNNDGYLDVFSTGDANTFHYGNDVTATHSSVTYLSEDKCFDIYNDTLLIDRYYPNYVARTYMYSNNKGINFSTISTCANYNYYNSYQYHLYDFYNGTLSTTYYNTWDGYYGGYAYMIQNPYCSDNGIKGFTASQVFFGDYDNDGDKDVFLIGRFLKSHKRIYATDLTDIYLKSGYVLYGCDRLHFFYTYYPGVIIYKNTDGYFTEVFSEEFFEREYKGFYTNTTSGAVADIDDDGDLDFIVNTETNGRYVSKMYKNGSAIANTLLLLPQNLFPIAMVWVKQLLYGRMVLMLKSLKQIIEIKGMA